MPCARREPDVKAHEWRIQALSSSLRADTRSYQTFDSIVTDTLKNKTTPRNKRFMIFGLIGGILPLSIFIFFIGPLIAGLLEMFTLEVSLLLILLIFKIIGLIVGVELIGIVMIACNTNDIFLKICFMNI